MNKSSEFFYNGGRRTNMKSRINKWLFWPVWEPSKTQHHDLPVWLYIICACSNLHDNKDVCTHTHTYSHSLSHTRKHLLIAASSGENKGAAMQRFMGRVDSSFLMRLPYVAWWGLLTLVTQMTQLAARGSPRDSLRTCQCHRAARRHGGEQRAVTLHSTDALPLVTLYCCGLAVFGWIRWA